MLSNEPAKTECKGRLHSVESFASVDGPGVRSAVFMQGCPLRCRYCHNADSWRTDGGEEVTPAELWKKLLRFSAYWGKNGGVTVSGGEPMLQLEFVTELFRLARAEGVHTALDTSGVLFTEEEPNFSKIKELLSVTELVILDIKHMDSEAHRSLTGRGNESVIRFARYLSDTNKPMWIRRVLVPGITDDEAELRQLRDLVSSLETVEKLELLPYHSLGAYKWRALGMDYPLEGVKSPTAEELERARRILGIE